MFVHLVGLSLNQDVTGKAMGPMIPDFLPPDRILDDFSQDDYTTFILSDSQSIIDREGNIRAVEGYGLTPGDMELQIYRPSCGNDSCPFPANAILCPESSILCMRSKTCVNPTHVANGVTMPRKDLRELCRSSSSVPQFSEYKLIRRVKLTIVKGNFFIRLSRPRKLKPGDILAIRTRGGVVARRKFTPDAYDFESPDWKLMDGNPDEPLKVIHSGQMVPLDNIKYMMRLITYEDISFSPLHEYTNASVYPVELKITTPWADDGVVKITQKVTVSEAIDRLRMRVSPPNAAVDAPVAVSIILSSGTGVKLLWDFGDGLTDEDMVDVSHPNEKFTRFHNYSRPGTYDIKVKASNIQSDLSSGHSLQVQYPITKDWVLSSNSPQLLPGQYASTLLFLMRLDKR